MRRKGSRVSGFSVKGIINPHKERNADMGVN